MPLSCVNACSIWEHGIRRGNRVGLEGWDSLLSPLASCRRLLALNGCRETRALLEGGCKVLDLAGKHELGAAAALWLPRSASTLTRLDLRCVLEGWG